MAKKIGLYFLQFKIKIVILGQFQICRKIVKIVWIVPVYPTSNFPYYQYPILIWYIYDKK